MTSFQVVVMAGSKRVILEKFSAWLGMSGGESCGWHPSFGTSLYVAMPVHCQAARSVRPKLRRKRCRPSSQKVMSRGDVPRGCGQKGSMSMERWRRRFAERSLWIISSFWLWLLRQKNESLGDVSVEVVHKHQQLLFSSYETFNVAGQN